MRKKAKAKHFRPLLLLVFAVLATSLATSGTLAKYTSQFSAGASMQIAAFAGGVSDFNVSLEDMTPGSTRTVPFTIRNYEGEQISDVQLEYEIQVETTGNLPLRFELKGISASGGETDEMAGGLDEALKAVGGSLSIGEGGVAEKKEHKYELSVSWPKSETSADYSQEIDMVTVTVTTKQANPEAGN